MKLLLMLALALAMQACVPVRASGGGVYYPPASGYYEQSPYYNRGPSVQFSYGVPLPYFRPPVVYQQPYYQHVEPRWEHRHHGHYGYGGGRRHGHRDHD